MTIFSPKKSLRAKFTIVLLAIGVVPLAATSLFFYYTAKDALFKNVFKELKWNVDEVAEIIEDHFTQTGNDLLIASRNAAFTMYFKDPDNRRHWVAEQHKSLKNLRSLYPDMLDEACYIDASGKEVSRIVYDEISHEHDLSSEEERSEFFVEAFKLEEGEVYQGKPAISEDTNRWVLPNATPIVVDGKKAALLHFEVTVSYFQRLLKRSINPDRGFGFILNESGEFIAHTQVEFGEDAPFPKAISDATPPGLRGIYEMMMSGESGMEEFWDGTKSYYINFRPVWSGYAKGRNSNRWSIAYVLPGERVYVELSILRYNIIAISATLLCVIILAYLAGNYITMPIRVLAGATRKVASGEMPQIEIKREDEIGQLSDSFRIMAEAIKRRDEELKTLATTDGLTGLYNYRYFREELERSIKAARRYGRPLSLLLADVDNFKKYNDTHGHTRGDMVLKQVAAVFFRNTRDVDLAARYGGEEFVVLLRETPLEDSVSAAERIRRCVETEKFLNEEDQPGGALTVSIGVAAYNGGGAEAFIEEADRALYKAKNAGRNRVET